jgi:hypothetical protein
MKTRDMRTYSMEHYRRRAAIARAFDLAIAFLLGLLLAGPILFLLGIHCR